MIKLLDILNESYNPNIYQVNCKVVIGAGNRPITEIISDIRAIPGVTIVDTIESDYKTTEGRHVIELSLKIDPSPFNPFNSASYDEILSNIKKLPDVRGAQFTTNPIVTEHRLQKLIKEVLQEKEDRCKRIADKRYDKPSAYKSGAIVRCRKGNIWKDLKEDNVGDIYQAALSQTEKEALELVDKNWDEFGGEECNNGFCDIFAKNLAKHLPGSKIMSTEDSRSTTFGHVWVEYKGNYFDAETPNGVTSWKKLPWMVKFYNKNKEYPTDIEFINEAESLHKWFKRQGPKGKEGGWVDCNAPDGKGGYKSCGRKEGEKRSKYPSCRPTPAQCKTKGKGKKWGKTK